MPAATSTLALPYPVPADPVADADDTIKALAERVAKLLTPNGTAVVPITALNTVGTVVVSLPAGRFTAAPVVTLTAEVSSPQNVAVSVTARSAASFQIQAIRTAGAVANLTVCWSAREAVA